MKTLHKYVFGILVFFAVAMPVSAQVASSTAQVYQSSLRQLITLLQQEVAMLVAQLQSISDNQVKIAAQLQQMQQPTRVSPVFGVTSPVVQTPNCVENPQLTFNLSTTTTVLPYGGWSPIRTSIIQAVYQTGCPLNLNTPISLTAHYYDSPIVYDNAGNPMHDQSGTPDSLLERMPLHIGDNTSFDIGGGYTYAGQIGNAVDEWRLSTKSIEYAPIISDPVTNNGIKYSTISPLTLTLTVGSTTQTLIIQ